MTAIALPATDRLPVETKQRDRSIDYLRTTLTLMVLAHHSSLAYTTFASFNKQHMFRSTAPVVDAHRWLFFDYAENFNDVFFMSLLFFLSGLFVFPAIRRHGTAAFLRDRLVRLGLPFAFAVVFLMPIAYYASWQLTGRSQGFVDFYKQLAGGGFAAGPPWFLWVLLFFDIVFACLLLPLRRFVAATGAWALRWRDHPFATASGFFMLACVAYIPLLARFGFGTWTDFVTSPFSFQICRSALYALWFLFGVVVGVPGLEQGILSREGALARHWRGSLLACFVLYNALVFIPRLPITRHLPLPVQGLLEALLWVASCTASSFGFLALFRGIRVRESRWMDSLSRCAYAMYLVHYVFITWTQRAVLNLPMHASLKFLLVFLSTVMLSWIAAQCFLLIPWVRKVV